MKIGQVINGYTIVGVEGKDFSTKGSGLSMWTFVQKSGVNYFMKEFLSPTYPLPTSPGSEKLKERKKEMCEKFENHHRDLINKVLKSVAPGGNLIFTRDFFRYNTRYYKVTEKIDVSTIENCNLCKLSIEKKLLILRTITHSLEILHKLGIVHGDLKPTNILIKRSASGYYTSKLIDFDNSYFEGQPPEIRDEVVGDPVYYSPELENYMLEKPGAKGSSLTCKSDIFALGILFCEYLTGKGPVRSSSDQYASTSVNNGEKLTISETGFEIPEALINLVNSMLNKKSKDRPSAAAIFTQLKEISKPYKIVAEDISDPVTHRLDKASTVKVVPEKNVVLVTPRLKISMGYKKIG
jgi:serine/threonine protein kinase